MVANTTSFPAPAPVHPPKSSEQKLEAKREALVDAALVQRFNAGDEGAFSEIVGRYREKLFSIAFGLLRNRSDAEEIAQDSLLRAYRALGRFRGDSSLSTWLHRIATNLAHNRYWYYMRRGRNSNLPLDARSGEGQKGTFVDVVASDIPSPVRSLSTQEFESIISDCTDQMSEGHRDILNLRNKRECSYHDIARILGVKLGTVKSRIGRARSELRDALAAAHPEFKRDVSPYQWLDSGRAALGS